MYLCLLKQCAVANELQEKKNESNIQFNTPNFAIHFLQSRDGPLLTHAEPKAGLKVMAMVPWAHVAVAGEPAEPWQAEPFTEQVLRAAVVPRALRYLG